MRDLVLHLKSCYFREVAGGSKKFEYRLVKPFWERRLIDQTYDRVVIWDGYKKAGPDTVLIFPWRGFERTVVHRPHFGHDPVEVFAILLAM